MVVLLLNFRLFFIEQHTHPCTYLELSLLHYYLYDGFFIALVSRTQSFWHIFQNSSAFKLLFLQVNMPLINVD